MRVGHRLLKTTRDEMTDRNPSVGDRPEVATEEGYEPPRVEQVLTPAELEQEVRYAGEATPDL